MGKTVAEKKLEAELAAESLRRQIAVHEWYQTRIPEQYAHDPEAAEQMIAAGRRYIEGLKRPLPT